ncbi:MAG: MarR family transcriptional regulator [Anaerolineae bacterium]
MSASANETSLDLLETVPGIMNIIRAEMRAQLTADLTVPQFRTLNFLNRRPGASLSDVAEHIGITLPSTSVMVDGLVARGLVSREPDAVDRRKVTLALTDLGRSMRETARQGAQAMLAERLANLSNDERETIREALRLLRPLFASAVVEGERS